jgi:hypothetical protein
MGWVPFHFPEQQYRYCGLRLDLRQLSLSRQLRGRMVRPGYYTIWIDRGNNAIALLPNKGAGQRVFADSTAVTTRLSRVMPCGQSKIFQVFC